MHTHPHKGKHPVGWGAERRVVVAVSHFAMALGKLAEALAESYSDSLLKACGQAIIDFGPVRILTPLNFDGLTLVS